MVVHVRIISRVKTVEVKAVLSSFALLCPTLCAWRVFTTVGPVGGNVMKELTKGAGKATKGLLGFVGQAVQRTTEYLSQELTVGVYKVQIVKEMAQGGRSVIYFAHYLSRHLLAFVFIQIICRTIRKKKHISISPGGCERFFKRD